MILFLTKDKDEKKANDVVAKKIEVRMFSVLFVKHVVIVSFVLSLGSK